MLPTYLVLNKKFSISLSSLAYVFALCYLPICQCDAFGPQSPLIGAIFSDKLHGEYWSTVKRFTSKGSQKSRDDIISGNVYQVSRTFAGNTLVAGFQDFFQGFISEILIENFKAHTDDRFRWFTVSQKSWDLTFHTFSVIISFSYANPNQGNGFMIHVVSRDKWVKTDHAWQWQ